LKKRKFETHARTHTRMCTTTHAFVLTALRVLALNLLQPTAPQEALRVAHPSEDNSSIPLASVTTWNATAPRRMSEPARSKLSPSAQFSGTETRFAPKVTVTFASRLGTGKTELRSERMRCFAGCRAPRAPRVAPSPCPPPEDDAAEKHSVAAHGVDEDATQNADELLTFTDSCVDIRLGDQALVLVTAPGMSVRRDQAVFALRFKAIVFSEVPFCADDPRLESLRAKKVQTAAVLVARSTVPWRNALRVVACSRFWRQPCHCLRGTRMPAPSCQLCPRQASKRC
jgi:hypothetical protein